MITVKEVDRSYFEIYDTIPQIVEIDSILSIKRIDNGLGGIILQKEPVAEPRAKDLSIYERAADYEKMFDISTWRFYMAFDGDLPVGAATVAGTTPNLNMLCGLKDACVLWDIRVAQGYKHRGIGQKLFDTAAAGAGSDGYKKMVIECQTNNVAACMFYHKQGAVLHRIDTSAYASDEECEDDVQLIWHLDMN